jgi:hypothetical protein
MLGNHANVKSCMTADIEFRMLKIHTIVAISYTVGETFASTILSDVGSEILKCSLLSKI